MQMILHPVELPLRHEFTIARNSKATTRSLIVELEDGGLSGFGEAPESRFHGFTVERCQAMLETAREEIERQPLLEPDQLWDLLDGALGGCRAAQSALDQAAWDLWGKRQGLPLYKIWELDVAGNPPSDYTIGIAEPEVMLAKLHEFDGWPVYKIKLGTPQDVELVTYLRQHTPAVFRVDANCGWQAETAVAQAQALAELNVELIEQPLPVAERKAQHELYANSPLPLFADESCSTEDDVERCVGYFHGINIKLCKCGGLSPARRMLLQAKQLGLKTMIGCMTETTVGISAAAQLLPLVDYADLDGAVLLAEDVADGVTVERGQVRYPATPGTGVLLRPQFFLNDEA